MIYQVRFWVYDYASINEGHIYKNISTYSYLSTLDKDDLESLREELHWRILVYCMIS